MTEKPTVLPRRSARIQTTRPVNPALRSARRQSRFAEARLRIEFRPDLLAMSISSWSEAHPGFLIEQ